MQVSPSRLKRLLQIAVLAFGYWALARIGLGVGSLPGNAAPVWPPTGLALAAVLVWGPQVAPGIVIGEYFANRQGLPTLSVLAMCVGNTLEAVVGVALLKRAGFNRVFSRPRDVGTLIVLVAGAATVVSATIGNVALVGGDVFPAAEFWSHWRIWWVGDALGALIVAPLLLTWTDRRPAKHTGTYVELAGLVCLMAATTTFALSGTRPSAFLLYPFVAWAALRFGGRGASGATLFVAILAVWRTAAGGGPFATGDTISDLFFLDMFLAVLAVMGMLLSSVVNERDRSRRELETANAKLEARVEERTNALRADRQRLEEAQRIAHIGSWEWDAIADVMTCSAEMHRLYGFDPAMQEVPIAVWVERVHPDDLEMARLHARAARDNDVVLNFEHRIVLASGEIRWMRMQGHCEVLRGVVVRMNGVAQDVTEAKLVEELIRANEVRTSGIVEAASEAFVSMDPAGRITDWNRQAELTFGWSRDDVIGQRLPQISSLFETGPTDVLNTRREVTAVHRDGHEFALELAVWATQGAHGETYLHPFMHDISERQANKAQLANALEEAREASRSKSAFLANMSHEIRTPMNGVLGMVGLLLDTPLDARQLDFVETMATSAEALLGIIDDILDVSKIEAGKLAIDRSDFALRRLVQDTITPFMPTVADKGIELTSYIAPDIPEAINGDRLRLRQVMSNLLSNAVKFTRTGSVSMRVTRQASGLLFEVFDTGVGIPDDAASYLFDPFVQADASTTRRYGGSGLGLAICRQLVTLMEGEIGAEPREGGGSRFWFTLPLVPATGALHALEARRVVAMPQPAKGGRVLVVEDNAVNRKVAVGMLEQLGYTVDTAVDGVAAVDMFAPGHYRAILMDCQMPRMDGYDATTAIRALEPNGHTPIIAMTASAMASDRERCLAVGMDEYLSKPINRDLLATVLRESTEGRDHAMTISPTNAGNLDDAFDSETLEQLRSLDSDGSFIAELVGMFRDDIAAHIATLREAIAAHDESTIARTAHQAKGASANLGMKALAASLKELELAASAQSDDLGDAMLVVEAKVTEALAYAESLIAA